MPRCEKPGKKPVPNGPPMRNSIPNAAEAVASRRALLRLALSRK